MFLAFRERIINDKNYRLRWIFYTYLLFIVVFARLYQIAYENDIQSFVFAKDIYQSQIKAQDQNDSRKMERLKTNKFYIDSILTLINHYHKAPDSNFVFGNYHTFRYYINNNFVDIDVNEIACFKDVKGEIKHEVFVFDSTGNNFDPWDEMFVGLRIDTFPYDSISIISQILTKRLTKIKSAISNAKPNVVAHWSFIDFIYFSTITQATVGYGDMLPNSSLIRFIVTIQTLLGVFMTVILIAFSFKQFLDNQKK